MNLARRKNKAGFTLIELLIVVALIGLLTSVMIFAANALRARSRKVSTKALLDRVSLALETYHRKYNKYPQDPSEGADYKADKKKFWVKRLLAVTDLSLSSDEWKDIDNDGNNDLVDAWGNKIRYKRLKEPSGFILRSLGPDGKSGTSDDIEVRR